MEGLELENTIWKTPQDDLSSRTEATGGSRTGHGRAQEGEGKEPSRSQDPGPVRTMQIRQWGSQRERRKRLGDGSVCSGLRDRTPPPPSPSASTLEPAGLSGSARSRGPPAPGPRGTGATRNALQPVPQCRPCRRWPPNFQGSSPGAVHLMPERSEGNCRWCAMLGVHGKGKTHTAPLRTGG